MTVLGAGGVVVVFMLYSGNTRAMAQAEANNSLRVVTRTTDSLPDPGKFDCDKVNEGKGGKKFINSNKDIKLYS